jgi:hypothetical protein
MKDTDFHIPPDKQDRFATSYVRDPATNKLKRSAREPMGQAAVVCVGGWRARFDRR